jgi:poly-gamma-glutamate capsule biosynthesis protein CapA/YwtB (metallophosphatase superfamily)
MLRRPCLALMASGCAALSLAVATPGPAAMISSTAPRAPARLVVAWGGDVMLGRAVAQGMRRSGADPLLGVGPYLAAADLRLANLEGPLTTAQRLSHGLYDLQGAPADVSVLTAAGFDAMSVANNHTTDNGTAGLLETVAVLKASGIQAVGGGATSDEALKAVVVSNHGLRLAVVAFDATDLGLPAGPRWAGVARFDPQTAPLAIAAARHGADVVVALVHWGNEYATLPSGRQRAVAALLVGAGADAVIGHHPHVIQPLEWVPRVGQCPAFVAWSLGNLLFDSLDEDAQQGMLLTTLLGACGVLAFRALPVHTDWRGTVALDSAAANEAVLARLQPGPGARRTSPQVVDGARWWVPAGGVSAAPRWGATASRAAPQWR